MVILQHYIYLLFTFIFVDCGPLLLFGNRRDVQLLDVTSSRANLTVLVAGQEDAAAVDFLFEDGLIFWTDVSLERIQRMWLNGSGRVAVDVVTKGLVSPDGLACDWIGRKLYWTNSETDNIYSDTDSIEVANLDGSHRKVLYWSDLDQPRAIAVDPLHGYVYWTDWGEPPKIERGGMDGAAGSRKVLIRDNIYWPNGLTIDYEGERLYWADAKLSYIHSAKLDGTDRIPVIAGELPHPFAVTLFEDNLYWTDWQTRSIDTCNKRLCQGYRKLYSNIYSPMDIRVMDPRRQPKRNSSSLCSKSNGGCSHLCLISPNPPFYSCACPTGILLLQDNKTCAPGPAEVLLLARRSDIRQISLDMPDYTDIVLDFTNIRHAIAVDYDPVEGYVYWTDDEVHAISRARLNGTDQEIVIKEEVSNPDGIAVDWQARNLYWTDTGTDRIEVARLNGSSRRVLITEDLDEPRAIVLDSVGGYMFWTDWGEVPKIERAYLDGTFRETLVNESLAWPNGLALDLVYRKMYWADAKLDRIEMANMDGSNRQLLLTEDLPHVFGFTLLGEYIYWTDWQRRSIERAHKQTPSNRVIIIEQLPDLMGMKAVSMTLPLMSEGVNPCSKPELVGCSHLCLNRPSGAICSCPMGLELMRDNKTCIEPDAFLVFSRRSCIRWLALEMGHRDVALPLIGVKEAGAIDFDIASNRIYWTDLQAKAINRALLNGSTVERVINLGLKFPEGIAVDWVSGTLYWVDTGAKWIAMCLLNGTSRKVVVWKNVQNPRVIVVSPEMGHIYWSDWGEDKANIEQAALDGSHRIVVVSDTGRVNALTIDSQEQRLYWTSVDGHVIESAEFDGSDRRRIVTDLTEPFALSQFGSYVYWADWTRKTIERADKQTGENRSVVLGDLGVVMDIKVFHKSRQTGTNACATNNGGCSHLCIAHSRDFAAGGAQYHCACPTHYSLTANNRSCQPPRQFLAFSQKHEISRAVPDIDDVPSLQLPIPNLRNVRALAYDPVDKLIYWVEGRNKYIGRTNEHGQQIQHVSAMWNYNGKETGGPTDIGIDAYSRHLYWCDFENGVINVTTLSQEPVGLVLDDAQQKPRAIALAPTRGFMFWLNAVKPSRIERARLDGRSRTILFSGSLDNPTALCADEESGKLYWADVGLQRIEFGDFDGGNRRELFRANSLQPIGLAILGRWLYWIDKEARQLERVDKSTGEGRTIIEERLGQLSDLVSGTDLSEAVRQRHPCGVKKGGCSHFCMSLEDGGKKCSCPIGLVLSHDDKTCKVPPTCRPDEFACQSATTECIPLVWQCDGTPECEDSTDELSCPTCAPTEFRCRTGSQCILPHQVCDGSSQCADGSDEALCPPCNPSQFFECHVDRRCIPNGALCNNVNDCSDGEDEMKCATSTDIMESSKQEGRTSRPQYIIIVVVLAMLAVIGTIILYLVCYQRRANRHLHKEQHQDMAFIKTPQYKSNKSSGSSGRSMTPARIITSFSDSVSNGHLPSMNGMHTDTSTPMYERGHITGASSSTSSATSRYPKDSSLPNPPPSPVTDDRSCCDGDVYASSSNVQSVSLLRQSHHHNRRKKFKRRRPGPIPPPTTPCSTDVCEESEAAYSSSNTGMYYGRSDDEMDPFCPPPPTPHSRCLSDVTSQPPSPCTERSFFNPNPPPPSPMALSDC